VKIPYRVSIRHRPENINNRWEFGHWEGDTIVGNKHKTGIHTQVERISRLLFAYQIPHIRAKETYLAQRQKRDHNGKNRSDISEKVTP
jgi:transposase, IS30 family